MKLLIIDDEKGIRSSLKNVLGSDNFEIIEAEDGIKGENILFEEKPEIAILDIRMPGKNGINILEKAKKTDELDTEIIVITGYADVELAVKATKMGAFDFIEKPFSPDRIKLTVRNAISKFNLKRKNKNYLEEEKNRYKIIGESEQIKELKKLVENAARTDSTVLITGESGSGKELVARNVHLESNRCLKPFVYLNCAAIPEELVESELFGHKKGSFTGAIEDKIGKFKQADTGTIFLDEIADLSDRAQAKVLRVIENGELQRIGENKTESVDTRIIAATNKNLNDEMKEGKFREDLFFRLNVITIEVPPLRKRKNDIPVLTRYFSKQLSYEMGKSKKTFTDKLLKYLKNKPWKGNVRQLKNFVERVYAFVENDEVGVNDVLTFLEDENLFIPSQKKFKSYKNFMVEAEKVFLKAKLNFYNWNVAKTARQIGMSRANLTKKIKKLDLNQKRDRGEIASE